jgi:hypothetical protein
MMRPGTFEEWLAQKCHRQNLCHPANVEDEQFWGRAARALWTHLEFQAPVIFLQILLSCMHLDIFHVYFWRESLSSQQSSKQVPQLCSKVTANPRMLL